MFRCVMKHNAVSWVTQESCGQNCLDRPLDSEGTLSAKEECGTKQMIRGIESEP
jgi:hypothetical protein